MGPCLQARDPCVPLPSAVPASRSVSQSRGMGFPFVRRVVESLSRRWGARSSEEQLVPFPGEVGGPKLRRASGSLPRASDSRCSEERRPPFALEAASPDPPKRVARRNPREPRRPTRRSEPLAATPWSGFATRPKRLASCSPRRASSIRRPRWSRPVAGFLCPLGQVTDVRGRNSDTMKLRFAEANPHVTGRASLPRAEAPDLSTRSHSADTSAEALTRPQAARPSRRLAQPPRSLQVVPHSNPKAAARFTGRSPRSPLRCARTHRGGPASGPVEISRSSRLQGFAPLTSPS